ncbi:MAG: putative glycoside hydrolase [Patescibacteria group bacterium]
MRNDISAFRLGNIMTKVVVIFVFTAAVLSAVFYLGRSGNLIEKTRATDSYAEIVQPYVGSQVIAHTDAMEGSNYEWTINAEPVQSGTVPTTFLSHFDGDLRTITGEEPITSSSVTYESVKFGQGMVGTADYPMTGNLDVTKGTLDLWLTLKKPLDDPEFDSSPYILYYHNSSTGDSFIVNVHNTDVISFTMYDFSDGWELAVQASTSNYTIPVGVPFHFVATWSVTDKVAKVYLNGEQVSRRDYEADQHFPEIVVGAENVMIGNTNVVMDEIRVSNDVLSTDQIKDSYVRGMPYSESDIYYNGIVSEGDTVELSVTNGGIPQTDSATVAGQKITVTSPAGYFILNTDTFTVSFNTPTVMTCHYGAVPDSYANLPQVTEGTGTSHTITYNVDTIVEQFPVAIKCHGVGDEADDYAFFRRYRVLPEPKLTYPKLSKIWWGNTVLDSEVPYLAKFDFVNTSKSNITKPGPIKQLKTLNPNQVVLVYQDMIGVQNYGGVAYHSESDRVLESWRLQSSEVPGDFCRNLYYAGNDLYNLNVNVPFGEQSADHTEKDLIDRLSYFDGIWWDVVGPDFWFLYDYNGNPASYVENCDFDNDGIDEDLNITADRLKAQQIWANGIHDIMLRSRQKLGQEVLMVGNGNASVHSDFNGKHLEHFFTPSTFLQYFDPNNVQGFLYWQNNSKEPRMNDNLYKISGSYGTQSFYKSMRYGLTASLLAGVYFDPNSGAENVNNTWWFDEYWIDTETARPTDILETGSGYLGEPQGDYYMVQSNVYRRDFENGIVLLNNTSGSSTINLGGTYRYLDATNGGQDPVANLGGETDSVTMSWYDGRILLNPLPPQDSTPPGTINDLYTE